MSDTDFPITIFHNPNCGTSRNVVAATRAAGYAPEVVEYMKVGWTRPQLQDLFAQMGVTAREVLREKEKLVVELGLAQASQAALLDAMVAHPILVNRPIVVTPKGAKLCRPADQLNALLD